MKTKGMKNLISGIVFIIFFTIWTILIKRIDVQPIGANVTNIGFAIINGWFHSLTGVNMTLYTITDWLGLVPIFICMFFGFMGLIQLIKRKNLLKVDLDIILLGVYYVIVILCYLIFEMHPINYRPILINGIMEKSYPSSTTLLAVGMICPFIEQISRRVKNKRVKIILCSIFIAFIIFMVSGRLLSGVHWLTDVIGSLLLSFGVYLTYKGFVLIAEKKKIS